MLRVYTLLILVVGLLSIAETSHAQCCPYVLVTQDSYGDGWNGGSLELIVNGMSQGTFAAVDDGSNFNFTFCNGDQIELVYSAGMYENENTYILADSTGQVLFADGPDPATGSVFTGSVTCSSAQPGETPCLGLPVTVGGCAIGDNTGLSGAGYNPGCADYQGGDVWFTAVVPASGAISIQTNDVGGIDDTGLALWEGNCFGLTQVACDDDGGNGYFSLILANNLTPGETVYIQVWDYGGGTVGPIEVCVEDNAVPITASELPLVLIETNGQSIPDEPKITAEMKVIYNGPGQLNAVTDPATDYDGLIGIETRGASSQGYPQKPFGLETRDSLGENNNVPILGMPDENDWVLLSNYNDKAFVRNTLAHHIFRNMGHWSSRQVLCEVVINGNYEGIYVFGEKIKRDDNRVDIARLDSSENTGDDVTGGYIIKTDYYGGNTSWQSPYSPIDHPNLDVHFVYHQPKPEDITPAQQLYIQAYVDSLEDVLYGPTWTDPTLGYRAYMDELSFINYFLLNELARNNDGFKKSRYYHKDKYSKGGKLHAGPAWDFDWAWKNISQCAVFSQTDGAGWAHNINDCNPDVNSPGWYVKMMQDTLFQNNTRCRWELYRSSFLDTAYLFNYIDSVTALVQNAQARHYQRYPTLGSNVGAPEVGPIPTTFQGEVDALKDWIALRVEWLDANLPGNCYGDIIGTPEYSLESALMMYPNPATSTVVLRGVNSNAQVTLFNLTGQQVVVDEISNQEETRTLDVSQLSTGYYLVQVIQDGEVVTKKLQIIQ